MIVLLVIAGAWLGLLLVVLGMLHIATSTSTPRPVAPTKNLVLAGEAQIKAAGPETSIEAARRARRRVPTQAA